MAKPRFANDPFSLGVASGDPLPDGVVLWTRLAPDPLLADGGIPEGGQDPAPFQRRRADAYQAYYEHQPLRLSAKPQGPDMRLYRRLTYGRLAE